LKTLYFDHVLFIFLTSTLVMSELAKRPMPEVYQMLVRLCDTLWETNTGPIYSMRDTLMSPVRRRWRGSACTPAHLSSESIVNHSPHRQRIQPKFHAVK